MSILRAKQATSLRVDKTLYDGLATLARARGTSITRQLEQAIRGHIEAATADDLSPVVRPAIERVISESLEGTIAGKINELKERLAGLLARNAVDTAALYLIGTQRFDATDLQRLRKAAAQHVRGRLAELQSDVLATEEIASLKRQNEQLTSQLQKHAADEQRMTGQHRAQIQTLEKDIQRLQDVIIWKNRLLSQLEAEWERQGILGRRRPFANCVRAFEEQVPRPEGA